MNRTAFFSPWSTALAMLMLVIGAPSPAASQGTGFTPYGGYRLGGSVRVREGDLKLDDAPFFGAQLDVRVRPDATASIFVDYQPTTLRFKASAGPTEELFDINVWYFQAGGRLEFSRGPGAVPFLIGSLGVSWFDPGDGSQDAGSEYGFAGVLGLGAEVPLPGAGLRLQARVLLNNIYGENSLWCSLPGGCYVGIGGPIEPIQFDFGGGITLGGG